MSRKIPRKAKKKPSKKKETVGDVQRDVGEKGLYFASLFGLDQGKKDERGDNTRQCSKNWARELSRGGDIMVKDR